MPGPLIPSRDELNGGEIDYATESAAHCLTLADQYGRDTAKGRAMLEQAKVMKEYAAELRRKPLF